jgi:Adenine-specific methyltransferase EcoRI
MANANLTEAKRAKNDEFYTRYRDIELEVSAYLDFDAQAFRDKTVLLPCDDPEWSNFTKYFAQNFSRLGLRKLISTSYAPNSKPPELNSQPTLFETESPQYDEGKSSNNGKIFTLHRDVNGDKKIDVDDLEWTYLAGTGDFKSDEIKKLRDEADIIVTNPPFSLFKDFYVWVTEAKKKFMIIGNMNAITYKEVFRTIQKDEAWIGATNFNTGMYFGVPAGFIYADSYKFAREIDGEAVSRVPGVCWFTNMDHGRRHQPISLMTRNENFRFSKHKEIKGVGYERYDNYDAIEVPFATGIPSDFIGVMGVPISFLDKYNPEQFLIIGASDNGAVPDEYKLPHFKKHNEPYINGQKKYKRIFIQLRNPKILDAPDD